jgi:hypothetical protein
MLAFDDGAIARILIAATRLARDTDRVRLLKDFAATADPPPQRAHQRPVSGLSGAPNRAPGRRRAARRSSAAAKQRRYRANLRRGVAYVPLPVTRLIVDYLVRGGLLPRDREAADRVEIGLAAAAALERAAGARINS